MPSAPKVLIGTSPDRPFLTLQESNAWTEFRDGLSVDVESSVIGRVLGALHAVPDILLAGAVGTKMLMEVQIRADLAQAADGVGFRAFAIGDNGITEQARLLSVGNLGAILDVVAIWRIASVVVGQKYLHDINQNLTEIKSVVHSLSEFQRDAQRSKIESSYEYLVQIEIPLQEGERESAVRNRLEHIEADMDAIQRHLRMQFETKLDTRVSDDDMFGVESLTENLLTKAQTLDVLIQHHSLAGMTRLGGLQMLTLFPGEKLLKAARTDSVRDSLLVNQKMCENFARTMSYEISCMRSLSEEVKTRVVDAARETSPLHKWLVESIFSIPTQNKSTQSLRGFPGSKESATPHLDATKFALQMLLAESSGDAIQRAKRVASACDSVDGQLAPRTTRYLVEWSNGQPVQISEAQTSE
jgi:hypothetical protein